MCILTFCQNIKNDCGSHRFSQNDDISHFHNSVQRQDPYADIYIKKYIVALRNGDRNVMEIEYE